MQISPDKPPSMMQMFKLASNPKFREGAKRVVEELKKAGVDLNSEVRLLRTQAHRDRLK